MRQKLQKLGRAMVLVAIGSTFAMAQTPDSDLGFGTSLKLRVATSLAGSKDNLCNRYMGFGLEGSYTATWGTVAAEVSYFDKPGNQYALDTTAMPRVPGAVAPDPTQSSDVRRSSIENLAFRFSYEKKLNSDWALHGGLQVANMKYRLEYMADITDPSGGAYEDTYNATPTKYSFSVSPYIGVSYRVDESSSLEVNLVALSYTSIDYHHIVGTNTQEVGYASTTFDYMTSQKRTLPHIEFGYAFHF